MPEPQEATSPLTVTRETTATPEQVWAVIADGWTYSQWVVGNGRMRAVDAHWPAPGSKIHHTIGVWPVTINDETVVEACTPMKELVLHAKTRPFGGARITLRLNETASGGCRIEMAEVPVGGPLNLVPRRLALAAVWPRNRECTWRLAAQAERRTQPE
jgi:uncharacterized protein YndB with AHSA1/START domain